MSQRFFVSESISQAVVTLTGDEGHHLARVMRARPGDAVILFDGSGAEFEAEIVKVGRTSVELAIRRRRDVDREASVAVTLAVALPKGERQRFLVEKAVELGVSRLVPLETERGVAQPTESALERLRRAVIEASKQCGRNRLMAISPPQSTFEFFSGSRTNTLRLIAHPGGKPLKTAFDVNDTTGNADISAAPHGIAIARDAATPSPTPQHLVRWSEIQAAIGPEGGFTDGELHHALAADWRPISLGPRILRVETAALALAAWIISASERS